MNSQDYWRKRAEQVASRQFQKSDRYAAGLKRQYELAEKSILRDLESFYSRFAENNEVSMAEAKRLLTAGELAEFKMTLSEFRKKAKNNADGQWTKELDNVYYRTRVTRLEALKLQVRHQVEMLAASQQAGTGKLLGDIYEDTYHRTLFELNKGGNGILASFARADKEAVQEVISRPWYGKNYSSRVWDDRDKLLRELRTGLSQSFIRGDSAKKVSALLAKRMGVATSTAERLVLTESAHIINEATADGYKNSGVVQQYEILATLDKRTSETCRSMDGKVFNLSEREVSVNYPPFHARCRTTVTAYFDDEVDPGKRIAKDHTGKRIYIPANMKYEDWKKEYIDTPEK
ncbi:minor capsid protein [Paenibacillus lautus]|uniref:minor capsid protein n=1 Tax=Paenibacillus lautus TaxID=1401 RepID=UPI001C7D0B73|nr:minor capsid protein [Paenibacillus lautus]MBX4145958.1 minor capsid protein [Paenibacillus lautus]